MVPAAEAAGEGLKRRGGWNFAKRRPGGTLLRKNRPSGRNATRPAGAGRRQAVALDGFSRKIAISG